MKKSKVKFLQQDMFLQDADTMHWDDFEHSEQEKTINLLTRLLLSLSYYSVSHGGPTCKTK